MKVRVKGIDMAINIIMEEQTGLESWKEVTSHNQSDMVMTKGKQTV